MVRALFWKLMERFGVQGIQFVLQLILARLLVPEYYGILSMMLVFVNLANVFTQRGLNMALIQNKDVTEEDYSSVFWVTLGIALVMYAAIFFSVLFSLLFTVKFLYDKRIRFIISIISSVQPEPPSP